MYRETTKYTILRIYMLYVGAEKQWSRVLISCTFFKGLAYLHLHRKIPVGTTTLPRCLAHLPVRFQLPVAQATVAPCPFQKGAVEAAIVVHGDERNRVAFHRCCNSAKPRRSHPTFQRRRVRRRKPCGPRARLSHPRRRGRVWRRRSWWCDGRSPEVRMPLDACHPPACFPTVS